MADMTWLLRLPPAQQQVYFQGPALKPPPGVKPNFTDPPNQTVMAYSVLILCAVIVAILVTLQLYSRIVFHKKFAIHDGVTIAALAAYATFTYYAWRALIDAGGFVHQWNIRLGQLPNVLYHISAASTVYGVVIMLLKVGILLQWAEIFVSAVHRDIFWWVCHITLWINAVFHTTSIFLALFGCSPRQRLWIPWLEGKCFDMSKVMVASSFVNFFSDIVVLFLPHMVIWKLHMSAGKKFGTGAIFSAGISATICAGLHVKASFILVNSADLSYNVCALGIWCVGEMTAGFLVLCLPALPKMFKASPWILKVVAVLRSISGAATAGRSGEQAKNSNRSWPRLRPRRDPDASLFDETQWSKQSSVSMAEVNPSKSEGRQGELRV